MATLCVRCHSENIAKPHGFPQVNAKEHSGGQFFSKSFLGSTTYKMGFVAREGLGPAILLLIPLVILYVLIKLLPPWYEPLPPLGSAPSAE